MEKDYGEDTTKTLTGQGIEGILNKEKNWTHNWTQTELILILLLKI